MEVKVILKRNGKPVEDVTAMIVDGDASWPEIAASSNENGEVALIVSEPGKYTVRIFSEQGERDVVIAADEVKTIEI